MAKFTTPTRVPRAGETIKTHEGGIGFVREPKVELFITAVSTLGEPTAYESADDRWTRIARLSNQLGVEDSEWTLNLVRWLRGDANMRSVAIAVACEAVAGRLMAGKHDGASRKLISAACLRADEPGQIIAYWHSRYGRKLPAPVKRGVADAAQRLFSERAALRYDGGSDEYRLGDVIELAHPKPKGPAQSALFGWLLDRRHGRRTTPDAELDLLVAVRARARLNAMPIMERHAFADRVHAGEGAAEAEFTLALAGQWEWARSWLGEDSKNEAVARMSAADQWELFVRSGMGYMALLRNLRNFDEAVLTNDMAMMVKGRLIDLDEIQSSRQFPFRFYSAYKATNGNHWEPALALALDHSLVNVPALSGRTLVMVDRSGSMYRQVSERSSITWAEQASLFGLALARRAEDATLVQFGTRSQAMRIDRSKSVLQEMATFSDMGGTNTAAALGEHFKGHDRVVIVTDEQAHDGDVGRIVSSEVPVYTWNLAGYRAAHASGENRHWFGGLNDSAFRLIPLIEAGSKQEWPWE